MLAVRLPEDLEYKLAKFAKTENKTKTEVVKEALSIFLEKKSEEKRKTPYELGESLFGRYESGRNDLSSTYKERVREIVREKYGIDR